MRRTIAIILDFFWRNKFIFVITVFNIVFNVCLWLLFIWRLKPQPDPIFLHYNIYYGIDLIGEWWKAYFFLPGSGLLFFLINYILAFFLYPREKIISYFLIGVSLLAQIVFLVAGFFTVLLNLSK